jgi:hypothetical protein
VHFSMFLFISLVWYRYRYLTVFSPISAGSEAVFMLFNPVLMSYKNEFVIGKVKQM